MKRVEHKSESRNNHRFAVVAQDLTIQWMQSYPCKTGDGEEFTRVSGAVTEAKSYLYERFIRMWQLL